MKIKDYFLKEQIDIKCFSKVFCRHEGEHLGWILFKIPLKINHHNSLIKGDANKVLVFLKNFKLLIIEEYQVDSIELAKRRAKEYFKNYSTPDKNDFQDKHHILNVECYKNVLEF
jgi:hypothetical protein